MLKPAVDLPAARPDDGRAAGQSLTGKAAFVYTELTELVYTEAAMGISIRDPEVGELARELARLRKTNMTEAIAHALAQRDLKREREKRPLAERLEELADETMRDGRAQSARRHERRDRRAVGTVIFVDTSAIRRDTPRRRATRSSRPCEAIADAERRLTSPAVRLETCMVFASRRDISPRVREESVRRASWRSAISRRCRSTSAIGAAAVDCFRDGTARVDIRARLNFADCLSYACAKAHGATLLFKGDDFAQDRRQSVIRTGKLNTGRQLHDD